MKTRRTPLHIKTIGILLVLFVFCGALWGCGGSDAASQTDSWPKSPHADSDFSEGCVIMETALEAYGPGDTVISYVIINTGSDPVSFDDEFRLEYYLDGTWLTVPFINEVEPGDAYILPGMQASRIDVSLALFRAPLPEGLYRIVRMVGNSLVAADFAIAGERSNVRDMLFGHVPLSTIPEDYDAIDAQNDGYYTILEDGVYNQEVLQFFTDRVHLGVPAKLRTVWHTPGGAVLVRDVIYDPHPDGHGRFIVILCDSRRIGGDTQLLTEQVYSSLSIVKVGNKRKVCLSNYVSHITDAPAGAPYELMTPDASDNIDLVATMELRVEENALTLPYKFLIYGPDGSSYASISKDGTSFSYKTRNAEGADIKPDQSGVTIKVIKWTGSEQLSLFGAAANGQSWQYTYDIEPGQ